MTRIAEIVAAVRKRLRDAAVAEAEIDARQLVAATFDVPLTRLGLAEVDADAALLATLDARVGRRIGGEPVGRILGERGFWSLTLALGPACLEPRPDTEAVVEAALAALPAPSGRTLRVADLGTGTGAILLAILVERPDAVGLGLDIAPGAVAVARANAERAGVAARALFAVGDYTAPLAPGFDLVVSNPPYIPSGEIAALPREVRLHDPVRALDGGVDGLDPYRRIFADAARVLCPGGPCVVEVGDGAGSDVAVLATASGLAFEAWRSDLRGHPRALTTRRPAGN